MSYRKETGGFLSADKRTEIKYSVFTPDCVPRAIIQAEHGMGSCIDSYERSGFVSKLTEAGFIVCGDDHLGHGESIACENDIGHFEDFRYLSNDMNMLKEIMRKKYRHLPYIMYGHSLGSFLVRDYIMKYGGIDGAIISGTVGYGVSYGSMKRKATFVSRFRGPRHKSAKLKEAFFGGFNDKFADEHDELSWLSSLPEVRNKYRECGDGFTLTSAGFREVYRLVDAINCEEWLDSVPLSLPIFIMSGEDDPLGLNGEGIKKLYDALDDRELSCLKMKLYAGARHQILKDCCRDEVIADIIEWVNSVSDGVAECRGAVGGFICKR